MKVRNSPVSTFVLQLLKAFLSALTIVIVSRWLGATGRGEISLMLFYASIVMIVNEYVGGSSMANLIAAGKNSTNQNNGIFPTAFIWSVLVSVVAYFVFSSLLTEEMALILSIFCFWTAQLTLHYNVYQGIANVRQRNYVQLLQEAIKLILLLILWYFLLGSNGKSVVVPEASWVLVIFMTAAFLTWIVSYMKLHPYLRITDFKSKIPIRADLFKDGFWSQNGQLIQFLNYRLMLLFIEKELGIAETGIYSNALLMADTIWIFGNSFGTIAHMRILQSENPKFKADITLRYAFLSLLGTAIACLLVVFLPNSIFVLIFGADFVQLKTIFIYLIPAVLALGASTLFSHYLHAVNKFKWLLMANFSGLIIQVCLAAVLIPPYGLMGACIAADAGFIAILLAVWFMFVKSGNSASLKGVFRLKSLWRILQRISS